MPNAGRADLGAPPQGRDPLWQRRHSTESLPDARVLSAGSMDAGAAFATAVEIFS
jgi:hypothetical protein